MHSYNTKKSLAALTKNYSSIPMHDVVREKIRAYARFAGSNECYGFLLGSPSEPLGVVVEAILAPDQTASGGHAGISAEVAAQAKAEIENQKMHALGFWHSHGNLTAFHSGVDDGNMNHLIFSFAGNSSENKYSNEGMRGSKYHDGKIIIGMDTRILEIEQEDPEKGYFVRPLKQGEQPHSAVYGLEFADNQVVVMNSQDCIIIPGVKVKMEIKAGSRLEMSEGIAYSVVVNNRGEEFSLIGVQRWCAGCNSLSQEVNRAEIEQLHSGRAHYEESVLEQEIKERVNAHEKCSLLGRFLS